MTGRRRVWTALTGGSLSHPPKGEIVIEQDWLSYHGFNSLAEAVEKLEADLAVLPAWPGCDSNINRQEWLQSETFLFSCLQGPVTYFTMREGWSGFSRSIIKRPVEAAQTLAKYTEQAVGNVLTSLDKGCEGVIVFDDLAGDRGLLIKPQFFTEVYFPIMKKALEQINHKDVPVIFHSDGNVLALLPLLKEAGFWGIQGLQPGLGICPELFRKQGLQDWVFWGNFDFEGQCRLKGKAEIQKDIDRLLADWSDFPGYIFGSSGGIYKDLTLDAVQFAYQQAGKWRK